jgi:hypothetical protein
MQKMKDMLTKQQSSEKIEGELKVKETKGEGFTTLEVSHKSDSPDPRVGGTKIIFDSRLDKVASNQETELDAYLKVKQQEKERKQKPITELDKQKLLL